MDLWHYLINQFINSTVGNFKKAFKLSDYHRAYLQQKALNDPSDPDWGFLFSRYDTFHQSYASAYNQWKSAGGQREAQTLNLNELLALLPNRVNSWDVAVQNIPTFAQGTTNYKAVFPDGRKPFWANSKTMRVNAVAELASNMQPYTALNSIRDMVLAFHTLLNNARTVQQGAKGNTKATSLAVEQRRIEVMTEQFRDLGFLLNKAAEMPEMIQPFFDLELLRDNTQVLFTGTLDPSETEPVLIHTFTSDDELEFEIKGDPETTPAGTKVRFYLATTPGGTDSTAVEVEANALQTTITAAAFGISDYGTHRHLTAINSNGVELHYVVELL